MKKHINIPIFIPHLGCPNACVFCNQRKISGKANFEKEAVRRELETAFSTADGRISAQIAYFGGSFTGIERSEMRELLEIANEYIEKGKCDSIRISTRPDYINREILEFLRAYRVSAVELGIQSTDDAVLSACRRGHTKEDSFRAASLIKEYGMEFIGQMMVGLPLGTEENERKTAEDICRMGADGARIYPCDYFCPMDFLTGKIRKIKNTHIVHLFSASWQSEAERKHHEERRKYLRREKYLRFPKRVLIKALGRERCEKIKNKFKRG